MVEGSQADVISIGNRHLAFAEHGAREGTPVFYMHGMPGSRLESHPDESIAQRLGVRLVVADRPGYGKSDSHPHRTMLDWGQDVIQLADALEVEQFHVLGFSGGGPYALACACLYPHRVRNVAVVSCAAPFDIPGLADEMAPDIRAFFQLAAENPEQLVRQMTNVAGTAEALLGIMEGSLPEADRAIFSQTGFREMYLANLVESLRQGYKAMVLDMSVGVRPWGFDPKDVQNRTLLWHGENDANTPVAMGQYLAKTIPHCENHFLASEGHFLMFHHWDSILQALTT